MAVKTLKFVAREGLKEARIAKKITHSEMGGMIGTSADQYAKIERGDRTVDLTRCRLISALVGNEPAKMFKVDNEDIKWGSDL